MKHLYAWAWQAKYASIALLLVFTFLWKAPAAVGQTPYPMAAGPYAESFDDLAAWTADFGAGAGASRYGKATPQPTLPNTNTVFSANASGGVQKGSGEHLNKIVLLATGTTDGANAAAFDLYLDFSGTTAGTLGLDWATVFNSTGNRQATFKLQTNTGPGGSFLDLDHPAVVLTNNVAASGALSEVALPAAFNQKADARIRFFLITSAGGSTGSRPKISLDNIRITATAATQPPTPAAPALALSPAALADFGSVVVGAASATRSFTLSGTNLSGPVTITPPAGFEVRTGTGAFACCPLVLTPQDGTLPPTAIEVRFAPAASGAQQGSIAVSSTGAPAQEVALSGTGQAPVYPPTLSTTLLTDTGTASVRTGGTVESDGGSAISERGVVWATAPSPGLDAGRLADAAAGTGAFTSQVGGLLPNTTYYLRAYATNAAGTAYGEEYPFTTQAVALAAEPTGAATLSASEVGPHSLQLHFPGGNGAKRLVLARQGSAVDALPTDGTAYAGDAAFGAGDQLGTGNYVLYAGAGTSLAVTGLQPNTIYHFAVVEYNDNDTRFAENYLTASPALLSQATPAAPGQLLLEEHFNYAAGALLTDHNWAAHSGAGTRALTVTDEGLSYPGYAASGMAAALVASGEDVNRSFAPAYPRTPVYVSFLVKVTNANAAGDYFLHLGPASLGTTFRSRVYVRKTASNKAQFGISGSGSTPAYTSQEYDLDATHLLVLKYSFDENGNLSQLFVNPAADQEPATAAVSAAEAGSTSPASIGTLALRQGSNSPELVTDGIRVATTFRLARTGFNCRLPAPAFTATAACPGSATSFSDLSTEIDPDAAYAWDVDADGQVDYTSRGAISHTYPAAGTYTASLTITQGGCSKTFSGEVTVAGALVPQPITGRESQALPAQNTTYALGGSGASTFLWTLSGGGEIVAGQGTEAIQVNWTGKPGTHLLSVRYGNGQDCPAETASLDVTLYDPALVLAYPNPFTEKATIQFSLAQQQSYTVEVFDPLGHLVKHLQSGTAAAGELVKVDWQPGTAARGVYFLRITTGKNTVRHLRLVWIGGR